MHETSLVRYTLNAVEAKALASGISHVSVIRLVIGEMRGALPDLMDEAFRILTWQRPLFKDCRLEYEMKPVIVKCSSCGNEAAVTRLPGFRCETCGTEDKYEIIEGDELYIDYFEGE